MKLINFIVWLSAGAVIGWFASRMVQMEKRQSDKAPKVDITIEKS
jgi:hypothetical protein